MAVVAERHAMLGEAIEIFRELWDGGARAYEGNFFVLDHAELFDLPKQPIPVIVGVSGEKSVALAVEHGDGVMATEPSKELVQGFTKAKKGPVYGEISLAYAPSEAQGRKLAKERFAFSALGWKVNSELPSVEGFEAATKYVREEDLVETIPAGDADMVSMVRGMIADPDLVNKSLAGNADQVRPCIACNQGCLGDVFTVGRLGCVVNPGAGRELYRGDPHLKPAGEAKKVLVIGGGPAGMEAARVAATRGHKVTLAEATPTLGGTLQAAARTPTRRALLDIANWLEAEIYRLGVEVQLSTFMDENDVIDSGADAVIVATGSTPRMDGIQVSHLGQPIKGFDKARVLSTVELLMETPTDLGRTAVVIDDVGHYEGLGASEFLIERGLAVTYVTRQREIAPITQIFLMNEPFLRRMTGKPFTWLTRTRAIAIEGNSVIVGPQHLTSDDEDTQTIPADIVIFVSGNRPNRDIFTVLSERNSDIRVVGDANSPRYLQAAIHEGHMAGATV